MSMPEICQTATSRKESKSRRAWTVAEEKNLILAFRDIIASGWKSPNGFRSGFLNQLERRLKVYIPNTDLKGDPNISSKYTSWKKTYFQITTALGMSGFGWNSSTYTIDAEPEVWDTFLERFPTHYVIRGKPFPFYEAWVEIYGEDRANGQSAMDFNTAVEQTQHNFDEHINVSEGNSYHPVMLSEDDETHAPSSNRKESPPAPVESTKNAKKHKRSSKGEDQVVEVITEFRTTAANSFKEVVSRMGSKIDSIKARRELFQAIGDLPIAISLDDHVDATEILADNPKKMDAFFGMPTNARIVMIDKVVRNLHK